MGKLVLLRHGQSVWNKKNVFTGWVDVPLSANGIQEAIKAGEQLANIEFDIVSNPEF
ncbi:MAG: phosphoglycerate mutase, partial [Candidatus Neomarinimicrobiota bacterium]